MTCPFGVSMGSTSSSRPFIPSTVRPEPVEGRTISRLRTGLSLSKDGLKRKEMSFWIYILRCSDNSYYTGHTDNLEKRIIEHQTGEIEGYTSTRLPITLVFANEFPTREEALTCERQIKGWSRKKKEAMMRGDWAEVSRLACKKSPSTSSGRTE